MIYFIIWGKGVTEKLMDDSFVDDGTIKYFV